MAKKDRLERYRGKSLGLRAEAIRLMDPQVVGEEMLEARVLLSEGEEGGSFSEIADQVVEELIHDHWYSTRKVRDGGREDA